jgi:hypothetical protein
MSEARERADGRGRGVTGRLYLRRLVGAVDACAKRVADAGDVEGDDTIDVGEGEGVELLIRAEQGRGVDRMLALEAADPVPRAASVRLLVVRLERGAEAPQRG